MKNEIFGGQNPRPVIYLLGAFVGLLVAANAAGSKLISVGPLVASATVFAYAFTFPITDVVAEIYGKSLARRFVVIGLFAVLGAVLFFQLAIHAPAASFYASQEAFESVFNVSARLLLGGFLGYIVSQFLDIQVYHFFKALTKDRYMWLRNNASTAISQFVDTSIFISIAFYGVVENLFPIILGQYLIKVVIAALDTPLVYLIVYFIRKDASR